MQAAEGELLCIHGFNRHKKIKIRIVKKIMDLKYFLKTPLGLRVFSDSS